MRSRGAVWCWRTCLVVGGLVGSAGCSELWHRSDVPGAAEVALRPSEAAPAPSSEACGGCHAAGTRAEAAWLAAAVYPDLFGAQRRVQGDDAASLEPGRSRVVPVDTTLAEWEAWQAIVQARTDKGLKTFGLGQTCAGCHGRSDRPVWAFALRDRVSGTPVEADQDALLAQHAWWRPSETPWTERVGLWIDGDTYRTMVQGTVKVLNHGVGHRTPSRPGQHMVLLVDGADAAGRPLRFVRGRQLPGWLGESLAGQPGLAYARVYVDAAGRESLSSEGAVAVASDSRLQGGEHDELQFIFELPTEAGGGGAAWTLRARLYARDAATVGGPGELVWEKVAEAGE